MQFLTGLFGGSEGTILNAVLALGVVLVLILLALWLLKFVFRTSGSVGKGRNRRLSVVDSVAVDTRRQLIIVRRDDVEHLILIGGPQDVVVETGIPAEPVPARQNGRRPAAPQPSAPLPKAVPPVQAEPAARPASAKLRELAAPQPAARPTSLRHTGFMKAGEDAETVAIPVNADSSEADSARTGQADAEIQAGDGDSSQSDYSGVGRKADSH